jgi:hypothetical protein
MIPEDQKFAVICNLKAKSIWELIDLKFKMFETLCLVHEIIMEKREGLRR